VVAIRRLVAASGEGWRGPLGRLSPDAGTLRVRTGTLGESGMPVTERVMTGTILLGEGRGWSVSAGLFSWVVETLAAEAPPELAAALRASCAGHPGRLDLAEFPPEQRRVLCTALRSLPALARNRLPRSAARAAVIATIEDMCACA
jgi:hypothetical protein